MQLPSPLGQAPQLPQPTQPVSINGSAFYFTPNAPIAIQPGEVGVANIFYPPGNPRRHGAKGDGVTDDSFAIGQCRQSAVGTGSKVMSFDSGKFLVNSSPFGTLDFTHDNLVIKGVGYSAFPPLSGGISGGTTIVKNFNGTLCALNTVVGFQVKDITIYGQGDIGGTSGIIFDFGANCNFPDISNVMFYECGQSLADPNVRFAADSGFGGQFRSRHLRTGTIDYSCYTVNGVDSGQVSRQFWINGNGRIVLGGAKDTFLGECFVTRVDMGAGLSILTVSGGAWADTLNFGVTPITILGQNVTIKGLRIANDVVLDATLQNFDVDVMQSGGTFTDNSVAGNGMYSVHPLGKPYFITNKTRTTATLTAGYVTAMLPQQVGDSDWTWSRSGAVGAGNRVNATVLLDNTNLTANRTVTFDITEFDAGDVGIMVLITRNGGNVGGPWTRTLAPLGVALSTKQSALLMYMGGFWQVVILGTTP